MEPLIKSYVDMLHKLHEECKETMRALSTEQLDWKPLKDENSIAVLAVHIAGAEKFWVGDCILEESTNRDRPAEFAAKGLDADKLSEVLDGSLEYVLEALTGLSDDILVETRAHPRTGERISVAWALNHMIQHTALHLGHIQLTCNLLLT